MVMDQVPGGLGGMQQPGGRISHTNPPLSNNLAGGPGGAQMANPMMGQPDQFGAHNNFGQPMQNAQFEEQLHYGAGGTPLEDPQNMMAEGETAGDELDPEFLSEIETYLKECMENNELSIDMSDTLIKDHGAKMVAAAASLCDQLQELRLQQCGITDEGAIELFNELTCLTQL